MARTQTDVSAIGWQRGMGSGMIQALLLVPEALLVALLLCVYWAIGEPPLAGLAVTLLIISFITRLLALVGARWSYNAGRYREANALAQISLALYPWSPDGLALFGVIALANNQPAQAEAALRRAIEFLPKRANTHAALSGALLELGRPSEAAEAAQVALLLMPGCAIAHLYLAEAQRMRGVPAQDIEEQLRAGLQCASAPESEAALRCALGAHLLAEH
jgi:tetratricopeptide (TPR) repeat protein